MVDLIDGQASWARPRILCGQVHSRTPGDVTLKLCKLGKLPFGDPDSHKNLQTHLTHRSFCCCGKYVCEIVLPSAVCRHNFFLTQWRLEITIPWALCTQPELSHSSEARIFSWPLRWVIISLSSKLLQLEFLRSLGLKHLCAQNSLGHSVKMQVLIQQVWGGAWVYISHKLSGDPHFCTKSPFLCQ